MDSLRIPQWRGWMGFVGRSTPLSLVVPPKLGERKRESLISKPVPLHNHNHHQWAELLLRANALHTHWQPTTSCTSPKYVASYSNGVDNGSISCQICLGEPFSRCKSLCSAADHTMVGAQHMCRKLRDGWAVKDLQVMFAYCLWISRPSAGLFLAPTEMFYPFLDSVNVDPSGTKLSSTECQREPY